MYAAMPYFAFMEAMVSHLIHGGTLLTFGAHVSPVQFCLLVGKGEDGPCGATSMLNAMMCIISLCSATCHMELIDVICSRMPSISFSSM